MTLPELRPRLPLAGLAMCAALGILAADRWPLPAQWPLVALGVLALALFFRPSTPGCWLLAAVAFFTLHTLRYHGSVARELAREFSAVPRVVRAAGVVWSEPEPPSYWSRAVKWRFRMRLESLGIGGQSRAVDAVVNVEWAGEQPAYGDRVTLLGSAENIGPMRNPGQFDYTRYQQRQGVYSGIAADYATDCAIVSSGHGNPAQAFAFRARRWLQGQLALDLADSPDITALIQSMVLGMRGETPDEVRELFQRTGTLHLFAVSGLNVAMLAAIALFVLKPFGLRRGTAVLLVIPILLAYALVTGLGASCVRATIMGSVVLGAHLFDRRPIAYNSLAVAAFAILAWDTNQLFSPGFQFSFVLVLTIFFLAFKIQRRCDRIGQPDPFLPRALWSGPQRLGAAVSRALAATIGVTVSAWIGSLFFTAGYFHLFSPSALFANLIAVPLAFAVLALGIGSILCASVWAQGTVLFNNANWFVAKALLWVVKVFAAMPGGHVFVETPRLAPEPACEFTVLDLGDGGAVHLRSAGHDWLLDCGSSSRYERTVLPYLRTRGVNWLDGLLLTHGDAKHIGGASAALHDFRPRTVVDSTLRDRSPVRRQLHEELSRLGTGKALLWRGDFLHPSAAATLRVLYPPPGHTRPLADDKALVLQLTSSGVRVLFMSDSGFATEQWLLENEPDLRSDIVVKGHHARDIPGATDFLLRVQPQAVICSAPAFGTAPGALDAWQRAMTARGITVFRQDHCGAVRVDLKDGSFELRGIANGQTFRNRAR